MNITIPLPPWPESITLPLWPAIIAVIWIVVFVLLVIPLFVIDRRSGEASGRYCQIPPPSYLFFFFILTPLLLICVNSIINDILLDIKRIQRKSKIEDDECGGGKL